VGPEAPPAPATPQIGLASVRQIRIGRRGKIIAAAVGVVLLAGIAGNIVFGNITTAEAAASAYISAVGANDADGIWSNSMLTTTAGTAFFGPTAYSLATKDELKAMLSLPENRHSSRDSIKVTKVADDGAGHVAVSAQYTENGHLTSEALTVTRDASEKKFDLYPYWRVMVPPAYLSFSGAPNGSVLSIDGIGVPAGTALVATFPGTHQVTAGATSIFAPDTEKVSAIGGQMGQASFKTTITSTARTQAMQLLKNAFADCAKVTTLSAQNCPQSSYGVSEPVTWSLVGDPAANLQFGVSAYGPPNLIVADGHFVMVLAFSTGATPPTGHRFVGGPYEASFNISGNSLSLANLVAGGQASALAAPSDASDTAIKAAVASAFKTCALITAFAFIDCPQSMGGYNPSNIKWALVGDPTASGVQITWDGGVGAYTVTGTYDMTLTFDDANLGPGQKLDVPGRYAAHVLWTAGAAQVVYIEGA
jgi:hypothetical protein